LQPHSGYIVPVETSGGKLTNLTDARVGHITQRLPVGEEDLDIRLCEAAEAQFQKELRMSIA
jgi:hypothetical protein